MSKQLFCTLAIFTLSLAACRKKAQTITIKASADDANTARIWLHNSDGWYYGNNSGYNDRTAWRRAKLDSLASRGPANKNDAEIQSVVISYKDAQGKQIEIKDFGEEDIDDPYEIETNLCLCSDKYSKDFEIPRSARNISISVKAKQTNPTFYIEDYSIHKDRRISDATVTLKVEVLKDGVAVAAKEERAAKKVQVQVGIGKK